MQPGTDGDDTGARQQRRQLGGPIDAGNDQFRPVSIHAGRVRRVGRERHQAGAAAQRRLARQPHRARHAAVAADDQHMAETALVRAAAARRKQVAQVVRGNAAREWRNAFECRGRHAEVVEINIAGLRRAFGGKVPGFKANETHGRVRAHRRTHDATGIRVQTGGNIHGQHRQTGMVDGLNGGTPQTRHLTLQPGAQQGVNHDIAARQPLGIERHRRQARRFAGETHRGGVALRRVSYI